MNLRTESVSVAIPPGRVVLLKDGGGGGFRTPGPRLMSPLLYHLSYTATCRSMMDIPHGMMLRQFPNSRTPFADKAPMIYCDSGMQGKASRSEARGLSR